MRRAVLGPLIRPSSALEVLVFADDPVVRTGLLRLLAESPQPTVGHPGDLRWLAPLEGYHPKAALWDVGLDVERGLAALRDAALTLPTLVLVPSKEDVVRALASGASGVLTRESGAQALGAALLAISRGLAVFDQAFLEVLQSPSSTSGIASTGSLETLTARERQVLGLLAEGLTNKQIAVRLEISEHTAKFHVNAIRGKFGVPSRLDAVVHAARLGLIDL